MWKITAPLLLLTAATAELWLPGVSKGLCLDDNEVSCPSQTQADGICCEKDG